MNKLPLAKRVAILSMLVEGSSMRSISRVVGVSINTVTKLLVDAGLACAAYHDHQVRNVPKGCNPMRFGHFAGPRRRTSRPDAPWMAGGDANLVSVNQSADWLV